MLRAQTDTRVNREPYLPSIVRRLANKTVANKKIINKLTDLYFEFTLDRRLNAGKRTAAAHPGRASTIREIVFELVVRSDRSEK